MPRKNWAELPVDVHTAIREQTGPIRRVEPVGSGFSSQFVATLDTARGRVFVKGMLRDHTLAWTQRREAAVNPYVVPVGPELLWRTTTDDWDLLCFEHLTGRSADYAPGSADLPLVVDALTALGQLPHPGAGVAEAENAVARFGGHLDDPADAELFAGTALLHTDWFYTNVHITDGPSADGAGADADAPAAGLSEPVGGVPAGALTRTAPRCHGRGQCAGGRHAGSVTPPKPPAGSRSSLPSVRRPRAAWSP
jgi:hypothetical protein